LDFPQHFSSLQVRGMIVGTSKTANDTNPSGFTSLRGFINLDGAPCSWA